MILAVGLYEEMENQRNQDNTEAQVDTCR